MIILFRIHVIGLANDEGGNVTIRPVLHVHYQAK
jgi:hypothetical protein